jgi:hypothetical protein
MDLNGLASIIPSAPKPQAKPEPEAIDEAASLLETMIPPSLRTEDASAIAGAQGEEPTAEAMGAERTTEEAKPEALEPAAMEPLTREPAPGPASTGEEPEPSAPGPDLVEPVAEGAPEQQAAAAPLSLVEATQPGTVDEAEPESIDEPEDAAPVAGELFEPPEDSTTALDDTISEFDPDSGEDWIEEESPEESTAGIALDAKEKELEAELEVFAPPSSRSRRSGGSAPSREAETGAAEQDDQEPEQAAEELWLWVDPRYEGGYSPATFDLSAFLRRAIALFQNKPWSGGERPARIAVHADEATDEFESIVQELELTVIEDPRVSAGTYWLGLGSDGESLKSPGT